MADTLEVCVNQYFRGVFDKEYEEKTEMPPFDEYGYGDCSKCTYDPVNNHLCRGYYPVRIPRRK